MTNTAQDLNSTAREAARWFTHKVRDDKTGYVTLKDDRPEWVHDLVLEAHNGGMMLPDDWRYDAISKACEWIADNGTDDANDFADQHVDVYSSDRIAWLGSHQSRSGYCDDAATEFGDDHHGGIMGLIGLGQYMELTEIFGSVVASLEMQVQS